MQCIEDQIPGWQVSEFVAEGTSGSVFLLSQHKNVIKIIPMYPNTFEEYRLNQARATLKDYTSLVSEQDQLVRDEITALKLASQMHAGPEYFHSWSCDHVITINQLPTHDHPVNWRAVFIVTKLWDMSLTKAKNLDLWAPSIHLVDQLVDRLLVMQTHGYTARDGLIDDNLLVRLDANKTRIVDLVVGDWGEFYDSSQTLTRQEFRTQLTQSVYFDYVVDQWVPHPYKGATPI
jgi:hypothetical protein